ncbi:STAS/SEC14 domain-containing protein [Phycisphaeraceae bacterium D3-23]
MSESVVTLHLNGSLTREDYQRLTPEVLHLVEGRGSLRLLVFIDGLDDMAPASTWHRLILRLWDNSDIERVGIVTGKGCERASDWLRNVFGHTEFQAFSPQDTEKAQGWVLDSLPEREQLP